MNTIRRENMREFIEKEEVVTLDQLTELFPEVSLMTVHRDLNFLQEQGFLVKIRGGARYIANVASEPVFAAREIVSKEEKDKVAEKAVEFLKGASSVFIDAGTTMMAFARKVPNTNLSIVTNGPNIALELAKNQMITVNLCGGVLNKNNLTVSGTATLETLSAINIDTAFLVASGYHADCGFTCGLESEAEVKKLVTQKARNKIMMIDSSKLGRVLPYTFSDVSSYDYLITDLDPEELPKELREQAEKHNVTLI